MTLWLVVGGSSGRRHFRINLDAEPCPTIMAQGLAGVQLTKSDTQFWLEDDQEMSKPSENKPPYKVPSMDEIKAVPWNGYNAISTFSGCGGSSLGYKMAGFRVLWANEFIPAAQETYKANHPGTILDTRDIRQVTGKDILESIGLAVGELDLLDGSPPCASFSTAGKREAGWGKVKKYSDTEQRVDDLFFEFSRLVKEIQPKVFIAENVSGLVKGTAKGYFLEILKALKDCGYQVEARLLDAQWLGVPQMRQRLIFCGVRNDLVDARPAFPKPLPYFYSVRDALPHIEFVDMGAGFGEVNTEPADSTPYMTVGNGPASGNGLATKVYARAVHDTSGERSQGDITDKPSPAITVGVNSVNSNHYQIHEGLQKRKFTVAELKRICAFPDDFILTGSYAQQWERLGRAVPPVMMYHIAKAIRDEVLSRCAE
jgi:DNA (cytosine-5)-methyltransferase 1